jgi:hypothetical protein
MHLHEIAQPIYYHASFDQIKKFWPLSHFGTYKAALSRIKNVIDDTVDDATEFEDLPVYVYPVRLNIRNPLRTTDVYNERPQMISDALGWIIKNRGKQLSAEQMAVAQRLKHTLTTPASLAEFTDLVHSMGYDALSYRNKVEDPGHISMINLSSNQAAVMSEPMVIMSSKIASMPKTRMAESERPAEMGQAYFWIHGKLVDIRPYRNHRDWLLAHQDQLGLPSWVHQRPTRALWESYKQGVIRLVWDQGGRWSQGSAHAQGNVLYINGVHSAVWAHMRDIMHVSLWSGTVNTVVIEYVRDHQGQPQWYHSQTVRGAAIESLYRGRAPRTELAPTDAVYGGEPEISRLTEGNQRMNRINDGVINIEKHWRRHIV